MVVSESRALRGKIQVHSISCSPARERSAFPFSKAVTYPSAEKHCIMKDRIVVEASSGALEGDSICVFPNLVVPFRHAEAIGYAC